MIAHFLALSLAKGAIVARPAQACCAYLVCTMPCTNLLCQLLLRILHKLAVPTGCAQGPAQTCCASDWCASSTSSLWLPGVHKVLHKLPVPVIIARPAQVPVCLPNVPSPDASCNLCPEGSEHTHTHTTHKVGLIGLARCAAARSATSHAARQVCTC